MQHLEPAIIPLPAQSDLIKDKGRRQVRQATLCIFDPMRDLVRGQPSRKGQVKTELFHHIGIPPLHQQCLLARCQTRLATARQLWRVGWNAKSVKFTNASLRNPLYGRYSPLRRQGQKPAQRRQFQAVTDCRGQRCRKFRRGLFQLCDSSVLSQAKRGFQGPMKPIFPRCHRGVTQIGQIRLKHLPARHNVPTEPRGTEIGQRPFRRYIEN